MSTIGDQIIEALEEALADAEGTETGIRRHSILVPQDESDPHEKDGGSALTDGEPVKRRA